MDRHRLLQMSRICGEWFLGFYLSVDQKDDQQNRLLLRDLMYKAEKHLLDLGETVLKVAEILLPIEKILDDQLFWENKKGGLVISLSADIFICRFISNYPVIERERENF